MAAIVFAASLMLMVADLSDGASYIKDIDDVLREWQVRALFFGHVRWFDMVLPGIAMPQPYVSPWSRLIDLPYVALGHVFSLWLSPDKALYGAFVVWPVMMAAVYSWFLARIGLSLFAGHSVSRPLMITCFITMPIVGFVGTFEFTPTRIDHHNVQIIAMLAMLYGLLRWDRRGGLLIGAGTAISILIGLECLPFVALIFAGMVLAEVLRAEGSREVLLISALSSAVLSLLGGLMFVGPAGLVSTQCDAFSAPYLWATVGAAVAIGLGLFLSRRFDRWWAKLMVFAGLGLVLAVVLAAVFPACLAGPYAIIDPISRRYWFDHIPQEYGISSMYRYGEYTLYMPIAVWCLIAMAALPQFVLDMKACPGRAVAFLTAVSAVVLTMLLSRYIRFGAAMICVFLPSALLVFLHGTSLTKKISISGLLAVILGFSLPAFAIRPQDHQYDAADSMGYPECFGIEFAGLKTITPGKVMLPQGVALPFLFAAPDGYSVASIPFHRSSPGMKRTFETFLSADPTIRRDALAPFDYVGFCKASAVYGVAPAGSLLNALQNGEDWPGLTLVLPVERPNADVATGFRLFRIDHAKLQ